MLKRFLMSIVLGCLTSLTCLGAIPEEKEAEPIEIVETIPIKPNPVELIKEEVRYTRHWDEDVCDTTIQLSYEDAQLLMKIASAEAKNQGVQGMLRVMAVVINRVKSDNYPDTIWEVFTQENQFSTFENGMWITAEVTPECHLALAELEKNINVDSTIFAFETADNGNTLTTWFDMAYTYRDHIFYSEKKD